MTKKDLVKLGSDTAKGGFKNEYYVIDKFNNWKKDKTAQKWLEAMEYNIDEIEYVKAVKIDNKYKADVQVQIQISIKLKAQLDVQNLQVKLVSNHSSGGNQIDKRWLGKCIEQWNMPIDIAKLLKLFTGETKPTKRNLEDPRRMFLFEMDKNDQSKIVSFFEDNKILIVSDLLKGRGEFSADWMLVISDDGNSKRWVLKSINEAMNIFGKESVAITSKGSLRIGKIGMQRKGGDGGRPTANMLQFKINPIKLFDN